MLKVKNCLFDNIHVVSNFMVFDKEGDDALCIGIISEFFFYHSLP